VDPEKVTNENKENLQEEWARKIQDLIRVRPHIEIVEPNSIPRDEKQFIDIRA
jgi:phenylacetate-coenzyme A ligase PaaK-like adenylate-forming protein